MNSINDTLNNVVTMDKMSLLLLKENMCLRIDDTNRM